MFSRQSTNLLISPTHTHTLARRRGAAHAVQPSNSSVGVGRAHVSPFPGRFRLTPAPHPSRPDQTADNEFPSTKRVFNNDLCSGKSAPFFPFRRLWKRAHLVTIRLFRVELGSVGIATPAIRIEASATLRNPLNGDPCRPFCFVNPSVDD